MNNDKLFYERHIFSCGNERPAGHPRGCCKERGGVELRNYMKSRAKEEGVEGIRVNAAGCLDRCELGPVFVVYPEGVWYSCQTREDVDEVVEKHLKNGEIVTRLQLTNDQTALRPEQKAAAK
jgi:(2Fe-2S) ferredoxin